MSGHVPTSAPPPDWSSRPRSEKSQLSPEIEQHPFVEVHCGGEVRERYRQPVIAPTAVFNPFKYQDPQVDEYIKEIKYGEEATHASVAKELNTYIVEQAWFAPFYRVQGSVATDANTTVEILPTNAYPAIYDFEPKQ